MNVNFHLANGSPHPWLVPKDGFDEGVDMDMDSLLPLIQFVFAVVSTKVLLMLRRQHRASRSAEVEHPRTPAPPQPASVAG